MYHIKHKKIISSTKCWKLSNIKAKKKQLTQYQIESRRLTELRNKYKINSKVKSGEVLYCLILRTKTPLKRKDGTYMFFYNNCVCLLTKNKKPLATRVFGPISKQLRQKKLMKLASVSAGFI